MDYGFKKRLLILAAATAVASMCGPASAVNGNTYVMSCACSTSADFLQAAGAQAKADEGGGTFLLVSTTQSTSAYVAVFGGFVAQQGDTFWKVQNKYAVDESGNSLAGNTESQNQAYFAALDQTVFGTSRTLLAANKAPVSVNLDPMWQSSFINSIDEEVGPGIDQALLAKGIVWADLPTGTIVTVVFQDGTKAQFIKVEQSSDHWVWAGKAWNSQGKLINRGGSLVANPNSSGAGGGGASITVGQAQFGLASQALCTWEQSVTSDGQTDTAFFEEPC
jgi:hypothetical protein